MTTEMRNDVAKRSGQPPATKRGWFRVARWVVAAALVATLGWLLIQRVHHANQTVATEHSLSAIAVRAGQAAPDFVLTPVSGPSLHPVRLNDLRGRVVVLNFWSPSCAPCTDEAPILAQAAHTYAAQGVSFLGVTLESSSSDALAFIHHYGIPYSCGLDTADTIAVSYGLVAIPVTVIVDRQGTVSRTIQGAVTHASLTQALQVALSQPA